MSDKKSLNRWGNLKNPNGLKNAQEYAHKKNGICLSKEYINADTKLIWKCHNTEHTEWESTYISVIHHNSWCPMCNLNKGVQEFRTKNILEYLLDTKFKKRKDLEWNINPKTNRKLELDGYSEELRIAFEFQGEHHHKIAFGGNNETLLDIQYKDKIKKENCIKNNIKLIVVNILPVLDRNNFIIFMNELYRAMDIAKIKLNKLIENEHLINLFNKNSKTTLQQKQFVKIQEYVRNKNGIILSETYINRSTKMKFKCSNLNHNPWEATYGNIVNSHSWCPECNGGSILKNGLEKAKIHAIQKGGQCLSLEYINARSKLEWKCKNANHKSWYATYTKVLNEKTWCPECSKDNRVNRINS